MRMLLKASLSTERANAAIKDGTMQQALQDTMERLRPEAAYFYSENGRRTALFIFDMTDSSQLPPLTEPMFQQLEAGVTISPCMNGDDLMRGLQQIG